VWRPQFTTSALKIGLHMKDDSVEYVLDVDHFTERCVKFKREMEAVIAQKKQVYKTKEPKITSFFIKNSLPLCHALYVVP
jgi:hypothetical protein